MKTVYDYNYVLLKCTTCEEVVKIAKNKFIYFKTYGHLEEDWISDFLVAHSNCPTSSIIVHFL